MRTANRARRWPVLPAVPAEAVAPAPAEVRLGWRPCELSRMYGLPKSTISDAIRSGRLRAVRVNARALFVPREAWDRFIAENATAPDAKPGEGGKP